MKRHPWLLTLGVALMMVGILGLTARLFAYPTPSLVEKNWELTFTHSTPRTICVKDNAGQDRWYWYMPYKIVNHTGQDRPFAPDVTIATEQGDIVTADKDVPTSVFDSVKKQLGNTLLESPVQITGTIRQGVDFARESVILWPVLDHHVGRMSLFVAGLSSEIQKIKNPATDAEVEMARVFMIDYAFPSRARAPQFDEPKTGTEKWIMR